MNKLFLSNLKSVDEFPHSIDKVPRNHGERICNEIHKWVEFDRFVEKGGESIIIKAFDKRKGIPVAIKVALPYMHGVGHQKTFITRPMDFLKKDNNNFLDRFLRGCAIQLKLNLTLSRPGVERFCIVPQVYEISNDPLYVITEWVKCENSLDWVQEKQFLAVAALVLNILKASYYNVNRYGILHRDWKPRNIGVVGGVTPVLFDFTIAKDIQVPDDITGLGLAYGTPLYMSPQQIYNAKKTTFQDEVYQLGKVLFNLFRRAEKKDFNLLEISPSELRPLFIRATEPEYENRYKNVKELLEDYEKIYSKWTREPTHISPDAPTIIENVDNYSSENGDGLQVNDDYILDLITKVIKNGGSLELSGLEKGYEKSIQETIINLIEIGRGNLCKQNHFRKGNF